MLCLFDFEEKRKALVLQAHDIELDKYFSWTLSFILIRRILFGYEYFIHSYLVLEI
jgi:hypothetical protein